MTLLSHPSKGYNQLWRSDAYNSLATLEGIFRNPRKHTGKGYREKDQSVRGCAKCGEQKKRNDFSKNQWRKGPGTSKCEACVAGPKTEIMSGIAIGPLIGTVDGPPNAEISRLAIGMSGLAIDVETEDPQPEKIVTLFNFIGSAYDIPYSSARFQRVLIQEKDIDVYQGKISDDGGSKRRTLPLSRASFDSIFAQSSCVLIHDSMFMRDGFLVITDEFFDHGGLEALVEYFRDGGTVVVQCVEGIYAIGDLLSKYFGCQWKLQSVDRHEVVVTQRGTEVIGFPPATMTLNGKAHLIRAPQVEALVTKKVISEAYFNENYDPDPDDKDAYKKFKRAEEGQHVVCMYEGYGSEGKLIWNGDRGQTPAMKGVLEKLLTLDDEPPTIPFVF